MVRSGPSKGSSELKQSGTQENTQLSGTVFHAIARDVVYFVPSVYSNYSLHICMLQNVHASKMWEKAPISHRANTIDLSSYPNEKRILPRFLQSCYRDLLAALLSLQIGGI